MSRKEERSKQGQTNNKAKQHSTPKAVTFPKKNELPRMGLNTLDRVLYHWATKGTPDMYTCCILNVLFQVVVGDIVQVESRQFFPGDLVFLSSRYNSIVYDIFNPRRACAARVTVVVLCVCVCAVYSRTTGYEAAYERYQQLQFYKSKKNNVAILLKRLRSGDMAWKQAKKPICIMSTGLPRPCLARSAHRGRTFLRGYVSKSSAAVNPLTSRSRS